jgi:hypothetical protein
MAAQAPPAPASGAPRRIHSGELASAACAMALLVLMFATAWYGVDRPPGKTSGAERVTTVDAWNSLTLLRWLMLLTIIVAVGSLLLHMTQRSHGVSTDTSGTVTLLGFVTALLVAYRVLIDLPSAASIVDQKLGAYLGMLAAFGIALGGYHALRAARTGARDAEAAPARRQTTMAGAERPRAR